MLNRLKQLHKMWKLTKKNKTFAEFIDNISEREIKAIPDENEKAEFIHFGTQDQFNKYQREEVQGWRNIAEKFKP